MPHMLPNIYFFALIPILTMAGAFYAPRLRAETASGKPTIVWGKFIQYGLILSAVSAVALIAGLVSAGWRSSQTELGLIVLVTVGSLWLGFLIACVWWAYPLVNKLLSVSPAAGFKRSFFFRKFKTGPAWGMFWAVFFAIPYFVIIAIVRVQKEGSSLLPYIILFIVTVSCGVLWSIVRMREIKKCVDGDKVVLPDFYSEKSFPAFFRSYLLGAALVVVPVFITQVAFGATDEIWGAALLGFFLGATAHRYFWIHLYEKRNNVQLVHEIADSGQPAESSAL